MIAGNAAAAVADGRSVVAPSTDDWDVAAISSDIDSLRDESFLLRVTVLPFLAHFKHSSFMQYSLERGRRIAHSSEWRIRCGEWEEELKARR